MAVFTVHQPPAGRYDTSPDPLRFAVVRDGFSFWAFLFGPLWMLRHRMWLVVLGYIVVVVAMEVAMRWVGAGTSARLASAFLLALLIGLEAGSLRRFTLSRRRWSTIGLVVADDREAAERRFFDSWASGHLPLPPLTPPRPAASAAPPPPPPEVVGLFPHPGASR